MDVIRRRECPEHGPIYANSWSMESLGVAGSCGHEGCGKRLVTVKYVRADQFAGAVEALTLVQKLLDMPPERILDDAERVHRIKLVVDTFLHPHGGQYDPAAAPRKEQD